MLSDTAARRLHPSSILFNLLGEVKAFALPALLLLFGGGSGDRDAAFWVVSSAIAATFMMAVAAVRYFSFTYTYGHDELIVRSGMFFKRERHIPYSRIQNIDATQNIAHALFGVYSVALETGSGAEAEATLNVLPERALTEMRRRVFEGRDAHTPVETPSEGQAPATVPREVLLHLTLRDLAICGLVRGRGLLLLSAIIGVLFDLGLDDAVVEPIEREETRGPIASAIRSMATGLSFDVLQVIALAAVLLLIVAMLRIASMIYTMQRLYGFTLALEGGELRMTYGLLTRIGATIPIRRIQSLTVREGPLHRLFGVCSVRADTAGGEANAQTAGSREWLAPIIDKSDVAQFVRRLMPEGDIQTVVWEPPHPRALRRALVKPLVWTLVLALALTWPLGLSAIFPAALLAVAAVITARRGIRHMGHVITPDAFMFKSGWIWRHVTISPIRKVQVVAVRESPFDRRHGMAALHVDTAGAAGSPHRLQLPYLGRDTAHALSTSIAGSAAQSPLSW